jgi:hypothetical protein
MKKRFFFLAAILVIGFSAHGQSAHYNIKGIILDSAKHTPLMSATVYAREPGDSTLIALGFTDEKGSFLLKDIPREKKVLLMIFYTGYSRYRHILQGEKTDLLDLGKIYLSMNAHALKGVTITGEKPPIAIRGDTIEFNAASFKTRPNSVLSGLLKKLPGVEVDQNGKITANGKTVDKILVDGKKFFGDDPKIALENLPAAIVDKVQVTDTKTREEEITGQPSSGDTKTINITLKKGKDHGVFGRAYAGYGTGKHYDASALVNYFEGKRRISLLGATNNINQVGFTMNEIADMMGGPGNIHSISINRGGSFGINGLQFGGGGEGLKKSTSAGVNYNDDFGKHFSVNGSYFYGDVKVDNETKTARQNILPDSVFYYNADNKSHNNNLSHRVNATLSYKDSLWRIYYEPSIEITDQKGTNRSMAVSSGVKDRMVNQSNSLYTTSAQSKHFVNSLNLYRTFKKKGQYLSLYGSANNTHQTGSDFNRYQNIFYDGSAPSDSVNQYIDNDAVNNRYYGRLRYAQPFTKNLSLELGYGLNWQYGLTDKKTFDYNGATGKYNKPDTAYSNKFRSNIITQTPQLGLTLKSDSGKWRLDAGAVFNFIGLHHYSFTHEVAFDQNQFFVTPVINLTRKVSKSGSLRLDYSSYVRQPDISQLLPVADNTNPLYIVKGNPDLKPSVRNGLRLSYDQFDFKSGNSIWVNLEYYTTKNDIANVTTYDEQLRQLTTYTNVDGNNGLDVNINLSKTKKKEDYHWNVRLGAYGRRNNNHSFVNDVPYTSQGYNLTLRPSVTYGYKELFEVTPSYELNYQYSRYDLKALNNRQNTQYKAGVSGTLYWPSRLTWESDWNYTHNSNVTPGFQKGYWLWNASVGLDLFKQKQATLKFSVYDLLNQNISVRRNITDTYIEDTQTIILHRYFMLKFIYNLRKFGEKKKKERPAFFFF